MLKSLHTIATEIASANGTSVRTLGLRFDKVVQRLMNGLEDSLASVVPNGKTVLVTMTAPILLPATTERTLLQLIFDNMNTGDMVDDREWVVCENKVKVRVVDSPMHSARRCIGLVHNRSTDASYLLDMTAQWILKQQ